MAGMPDPQLFGFAALAVGIALLLRRIYVFRNYPSAPGPKLAMGTHFWYMWKAWEGKFEAWNIEQHARKGKIVRVAPKMYSIDDPEAVKSIYGISSTMIKSEWYEAFGDPRIPNHNLFTVRDRQLHSAMRKRVASFYSMTAIKSYEPYVNNCVSILLEHFDRLAADEQSFDLQFWMQCYAFDVVGEITFGKRVGFLESGGQDVDGIMAHLDNGNTFSTMLGIDFRLLPLWFAVFGNPAAGILGFVNKLIEARQRSFDGREAKDRIAEDFYSKLDAVKEKSGEDFEKYRMPIITSTNVAAGSDTTSISLTSVLFYAIRNWEIYQKLRREILSAAERGEADEPITFEQAQKLPYLQLVIKEALRLHPATGLPMWRVVQEPGLSISGRFFPSGAIVGINPWVAHYNSTVFGLDATTFRPERWNPEAVPKQRLAEMEQYYLPFGAGTRTCIGKNISILEMTKLIPELVRRYDFELLSQQLKYQNHWFVKQKDVRVKIRRAR